MRSRDPPQPFRFPVFHHHRNPPLAAPSPNQPPSSAPPAGSHHDFHVLELQLAAATRDNSALRKQIIDQRESTAQQFKSLRQQNTTLDDRIRSLNQRITALNTENDVLNHQRRKDAKQKVFDHAKLRAETASVQRHLAESDRKRALIKLAVNDLTHELNSITVLHAGIQQELKVVKREREAALDDACNLHDALKQERAKHQLRCQALEAHIRSLKRLPGPHRQRDISTLSNVTGPASRDPSTPASLSDNPALNTLTAMAHRSTVLACDVPEQEPSQPSFHVLFNPRIPMTPIRALDQSPYVVKGNEFGSIKEKAFVAIVDALVRIDFRMVLNKPFSVWGSAHKPTMIYIGLEYPDGTSLCYAPVQGVKIKYPSSAIMDSSATGSSASATKTATKSTSMTEVEGNTGGCEEQGQALEEEAAKQSGVNYGRDYLQLCMSERVYVALVERAKAAFEEKYSGTKSCEAGNVSYEEGAREDEARLVCIRASMKPDAHVDRMVAGRMEKSLICTELLDKKRDLVGDALVAMRFCSVHRSNSVYTLGFKLYGMSIGPR